MCRKNIALLSELQKPLYDSGLYKHFVPPERNPSRPLATHYSPRLGKKAET